MGQSRKTGDETLFAASNWFVWVSIWRCKQVLISIFRSSNKQLEKTSILPVTHPELHQGWEPSWWWIDGWGRRRNRRILAITATSMVCTASAGNYKCVSLVSGCFSWFVTQVFHCWITASVINTLHDPANISCHLLGDSSCLVSLP